MSHSRFAYDMTCFDRSHLHTNELSNERVSVYQCVSDAVTYCWRSAPCQHVPATLQDVAQSIIAVKTFAALCLRL